MTKRKADDVDWENEPCPLCAKDRLPIDDKVQWLQCEEKSCGTWYHCVCVGFNPQHLTAFYCESCTALGKGQTIKREERPKRAKSGVDYSALDAGQHVNSLRHSYTSMIETRTFARPTIRSLLAEQLTTKYLAEIGFIEPIVVHDANGLDMDIPSNLTVDQVAELVGPDLPIEVMDVPTQGEDKGWTLGRWAEYYKDATPTRVRNVISLEITDSKLGASIVRPKIVRELDLLNIYWPKQLFAKGEMPKVQTYCLMSLQNSYTDFHIDFAGTSVYYHVLQGSKTFLFIPPTHANLNKYSDWCLSSDQSKTFLADECKETFKVELFKGDTLMIPAGWIHAVHTPHKSLVIGGNFLHLHGMQKHLEVAEIEDKTKVPGKFRFPQLDRTLWFSAIGILAHRIALNKFELVGVQKLAIYLLRKAAGGDKGSRKTSTDGIPFTHIAGDPSTLAKMLLLYVGWLDQSLIISDTSYQLTEAELSGPIVLVKSDFAEEEYNHIASLGSSDLTPRDKVLLGDCAYIESWVRLPVTTQDCVTAYSDSIEGRGTYADPPVSKQPDVPLPEVRVEHKDLLAHRFALEQYYDNNYIPPIMSFAIRQHSPPTVRKNPPPVGSDAFKGSTTCFRCKTRKRKCDKARPCKTCVELGLQDSCTDSGTYAGGVHVPTPMSANAVTHPQISTEEYLMQPLLLAEQDQNHAQQSPSVASDKSMKDLPTASENVNTKPKKSKKLGSRCTRCARDRKQCGRELPICERCIKKGCLDGCIYPKQLIDQDIKNSHYSVEHNLEPANEQSQGGPDVTDSMQALPSEKVQPVGKVLLEHTNGSSRSDQSAEVNQADSHPNLVTATSLDQRSRELAMLADQVTSRPETL